MEKNAFSEIPRRLVATEPRKMAMPKNWCRGRYQSLSDCRSPGYRKLMSPKSHCGRKAVVRVILTTMSKPHRAEKIARQISPNIETIPSYASSINPTMIGGNVLNKFMDNPFK